jgi:uncharacterized membrane protein YhdT
LTITARRRIVSTPATYTPTLSCRDDPALRTPLHYSKTRKAIVFLFFWIMNLKYFATERMGNTMHPIFYAVSCLQTRLQFQVPFGHVQKNVAFEMIL